jgi:hypothetical protein
VVANHQAESKSTSPKIFARQIFYPTGPISGINITTMLIQEILGPIARTVTKVAPTAVNRSAELFTQFRGQLSQIEQIAADIRNPRSFDFAVDRLLNLHQDLYKLKQGNQADFRIVREIERLADDLQGMIKHFRSNAQQPGAAGMFLQSIARELVPTLKNRLSSLESLMKTPTTK